VRAVVSIPATPEVLVLGSVVFWSTTAWNSPIAQEARHSSFDSGTRSEKQTQIRPLFPRRSEAVLTGNEYRERPV